VIYELVEDGLREPADEVQQTRLWTTSSGPEISSITECVCRLFDDSGLGGELDRGHDVFTREIDQQLVDLRKLLRGIDHMGPPLAVLRHPRLAAARTLAASILSKVNDLRSE